MTLLEEIVSAFTADQVNIDDLPDSDPVAVLGQKCSTLFTNGVATLGAVVPNERIQTLARVIWDLVGNKRVLIALGPKVPTLAFTAMQDRGVLQGIVFIPQAWPEMAQKDAFMQLGAILFVGAQAVDFYNDRLMNDPTAEGRWHAYEAELLHTLRKLMPDWKPNVYQTKVMAQYPDGLDTAGVELYAFKSYEPSKGDA